MDIGFFLILAFANGTNSCYPLTVRLVGEADKVNLMA